MRLAFVAVRLALTLLTAAPAVAQEPPATPPADWGR